MIEVKCLLPGGYVLILMPTVSYLCSHMYIFNRVSSLYLHGLGVRELCAIHEIALWRCSYFFRSMDKWRDKDGFLLQSEFRQWVESVVNKALNRLRRSKPNCYELGIQNPDASGRLSQYHVCHPLKYVTCVLVCYGKCDTVIFVFLSGLTMVVEVMVLQLLQWSVLLLHFYCCCISWTYV